MSAGYKIGDGDMFHQRLPGLLAIVVIGLLLALAPLPFLTAVTSAGPQPAPASPPISPSAIAVYTVTIASGSLITAGCAGFGTCSLPGAVALANVSPIRPVFIYFAHSINGMTIPLASSLKITGGLTL